jgi:hypothetical protein
LRTIVVAGTGSAAWTGIANALVHRPTAAVSLEIARNLRPVVVI